MKVKILLIDDGPVTSIVDKVELALKKRGITLDYKVIDINDQAFKKKNKEKPDEEILDFEKIKEHIVEKYIDEPFDIIACDYYYADVLNGSKILSWIKNTSNTQKKRIRKAKFCLYSSEVDKICTTSNTVDEIRKLITIRLTGLYNRTNLAEELITLCEKNDVKLSSIFATEMNKFSHTTFKSTYPPFKDKTFGEIAQEVDRETHHGQKFAQNLIELTINHLNDLNKD
jgi:hypothetical protein